ncbi:hypothetical protein C8R43DRAFT_1147263 [Mycena crocata]|nr:hypothetical protein C8R43DRAFT_1147263 [Mycena crocata]
MFQLGPDKIGNDSSTHTLTISNTTNHLLVDYALVDAPLGTPLLGQTSGQLWVDIDNTAIAYATYQGGWLVDGASENTSIDVHAPPPSQFTQLPNELLAEIFRWAVKDAQSYLPGFTSGSRPGQPLSPPAICLSHVCAHWRQVALALPLWGRVNLVLDVDTYKQALAQTDYLLRRCPYSAVELVILEGKSAGNTPVLAIHDIVLVYAARTTSLSVQLDASAIQFFLELPAGSLPVLRTLRLHVHHSCYLDGYPNTHGVSTNPTHTQLLTQLAPGLSSFSLTSSILAGCVSEIDGNALALGLPHAQLRELHLSVGVSCDSAVQILRQCSKNLERLTLRVSQVGYSRPAPGDTDEVDFDDAGMESVKGDTDLGWEDEAEEYEEYEYEDWDDLYGDDSGAAPQRIHLPSLTNLSIGFTFYEDADAFFQPLVLPALKSLRVEGPAYCQTSLVECLQRSSVLRATMDASQRSEPSQRTNPSLPLASLHLSGIHELMKDDLRELIVRNRGLTRLELDGCSGDYWKALPRRC